MGEVRSAMRTPDSADADGLELLDLGREVGEREADVIDGRSLIVPGGRPGNEQQLHLAAAGGIGARRDGRASQVLDVPASGDVTVGDREVDMVISGIRGSRRARDRKTTRERGDHEREPGHDTPPYRESDSLGR